MHKTRINMISCDFKAKWIQRDTNGHQTTSSGKLIRKAKTNKCASANYRSREWRCKHYIIIKDRATIGCCDSFLSTSYYKYHDFFPFFFFLSFYY